MNATENRFVEDYRFAASVGACRVYLANDIQTHAERASALTYVEQFKAECAQYPLGLHQLVRSASSCVGYSLRPANERTEPLYI